MIKTKERKASNRRFANIKPYELFLIWASSFLLNEKNEKIKSGAGQYFTPSALIAAMVACVRPQPMKTIADSACGTGGFFLAVYDYIAGHDNLDKEQKQFLKLQTLFGNEIVAGT